MSRINPKQNVRAPNDVSIDAPDPRLKRVRLLAKALDNSITIPGTGRKIGLDPIIGLIPGGRDVGLHHLGGCARRSVRSYAGENGSECRYRHSAGGDSGSG